MPPLQTGSHRHRMLAKVRHEWIDRRLKNSLDSLARIELGLEEKPDAVSRPWDLIVQQPGQVPRPLPPSRPISAIFDELDQALLILGAPGAGKTTLLLELARDLLDRAEQDASHPIPVVFHLSSWAVRRRPLVDWLVDELAELYYVPRKLAQAWTEAEQIVPLLDGLDEVALEYRAACVEAINTFRHQHGLVPLAVCSRAADYDALPVRVELSGAVAIEPLSRVQVSTYLKQAGKSLAGVRTVLRDDETLWELLDTPLMLSITALAYQGSSAAQVRATGSLEERRTKLLAAYTDKMFLRRTVDTKYTRDQTNRWLTWLAQSLMHNNQSVFYVEWMQPDWLSSRAHQRVVSMITITLDMLVGAIIGLVAELMIFGPISGLFGGLVVGGLLGLSGGLSSGKSPAERLSWSWTAVRRVRSKSSPYLRNLWIIGLVGGLSEGLSFGLSAGLFSGLGGLFSGLLYWLFSGLLDGLVTDQIATRTIPNEGMRRSLRSALISFLVYGLIGYLYSVLYSVLSNVLSVLVGGLSGVSGGLFDGLSRRLFSELFFGLFLGLLIGMLGWLQKGGHAYLKHYVLRFLLWCNDYAPWNYIRFLDYAAGRLYLRKVGGGYIFTHRLLMEYFATLQPTNQAGQTKTD